MIYKLKKN